MAIPMAARILGFILSESLPENEATRAIITGCAISIIPASRASIPFTYCKYKLSMNDMAKVAA
ncbi:hypothetical protein SDC9_202191 [bioreactor metagenome]|uniref:Uncharacterized protein n=1 Tax=bioreactor metagenome TaxID=1076179 RepID=A0A645IT09_9ZZZZ